MNALQILKNDFLNNGRVEGHELDVLRKEVYAGGPPDRKKMDILIEMHKNVERVTPSFEQFFYQALKDHLLAHGVNAAVTAWLRDSVLDGDRPGEQQTKFLRELRGEVKQTSPEFQALCKEYLGS